MVKRRKFLIGAGSLIAGGAAATGTGAFTEMSSGDRSVSVEVVDDANAYVALRPHRDSENAFFVTGSTDINPDADQSDSFSGGSTKLELNFTSDNGAYYSFGGDGVNPDSTYHFDDVFEVLNFRGRVGPSDIWLTKSGLPGVDFYYSGKSISPGASGDGDGTTLLGESNSVSINNGNGLSVGVKIEAGTNLQTITGSIQVHATNEHATD